MPTPPPEENNDEADLRVTRPKSSAAGIPALIATLRHARAQLGPVRTAKTLLTLNQPTGFDCPGCAWPDPDHTSAFEFCENGAKAVAEEATVRRVTPAFFAEHPVGELAGRTDFWLGQQGRLTQPMHRAAGEEHYRPVSWDDAFGIIADELVASADPDRAVFYTSGRTSNEAAFVYQLFVRLLGTNNLPDCSNMCHESSGVALGQTIGIGKGSVTLDDVYEADLVIVMGQNPGTNHPRMLTALEKAKGNGATIVAINPLKEAGLLRFKNPQRPVGVVGRGTELADEYLQIKVGADLALFQYVNRRLLEIERERGGVVDHEFVARSTEGYEDLVAHLETLDADALLGATGLSRREAERLVELVATNQRIIVCWAMGITQHRQAVATIREVVNTVLLRGSIGKTGSGVCPVRGHSNVQGDRTMGIFEKMPDAFLGALGAEFGFEPPREHGFDTVKAIHAMQRGEVDVFFAMGGNFLMAAPDTEATAKALSSCKLTVQVSTKLNRSHVTGGQAALILPALGRTDLDRTGGKEQRITVEDSMTMVHASAGGLEPPSNEVRSEVAIVCGLAQRALPDGGGVDWAALEADYDRIRDHVEAVVPGFTDFNRRIGEPGGFALPHPPRDHGTFPTPSGKAHLTRNDFDPTEVPEGRLLLQTLRSHDQYNTTIYGLDDRYRGIHDGRRVVFAGAKDLAELGFADGDHVDIVSEWTDGERRAPRFRLVAYDVAPGTCAAYFPEANVLVPLTSVADESNTPTSKGIVVRFERAADALT
ncbi:FdhF/YdeP family oxidoreductase [Aquihabitans sp. G128]|uniref:FdhF/YdeP family oxidoreductase n=1 Tax=Aquihabitans sp. G128 TaxID=2849779 RepID=UPI001C24E725|nr:FdhF/YdeP family oxidoreductase [Aquihabitans sp. G128]QXC59235.1 FdhF/YdeP family oxidoreductase [Aquihabitans sp. G128]